MAYIHPDVLEKIPALQQQSGQELMNQIQELQENQIQNEKQYRETKSNNTKLLVAMNIVLLERCSDDTGEHKWEKQLGFYGNWVCSKCGCLAEKA